MTVVLVVVAIVSVLGVAVWLCWKIWATKQDGPPWAALKAAKGPIVASLQHRGVCRVEYVPSFTWTEDSDLSVWLGTRTDAERDLLLTNPEPCIVEVREALASAGYPVDRLAGVNTTSQSQETVDRDYESSWFYALR